MVSAVNHPSDHSVDASTEHQQQSQLPMLQYPRDLHLLSSALLEYGAAYIVNPPLPPLPLTTAKNSLFALPMQKKDALRHATSKDRGYGADLTQGREWWDLTPETNVDRLAPKDDKFNNETEAYFKASVALLGECLDVLRHEYPGIPPEASEQGTSTLRYLHYSPDLIELSKKLAPSPVPKEESARIPIHTDRGSITLLAATGIKPPFGLHVYSPTGKPYGAPHIDNTVRIIIGDCLTFWTEGEKRILPTPHEVVLGHAGSPEEDMVTLAVFLRPALDLMLTKDYEGAKMTYGSWTADKGQIGRRNWMVGRDGIESISHS